MVLLIDETGVRLGEYSVLEARKIARDRGVDLVEIRPNQMPPVCRIMDYGKFVYQQSKRSQEQRRHHRQNQVKEVKFRIIIDRHDRETKMRNIERFLREGHKVKATIWFKRARERSRREIGDQILDSVAEALKDMATVESRSNIVGNQMSMILAPNRRLSEERRAERGAKPAPPAPRVRRPPRPSQALSRHPAPEAAEGTSALPDAPPESAAPPAE